MSDTAAKTTAAADALLSWLRTQPKRMPASASLPPHPPETQAAPLGVLFDGGLPGEPPVTPNAAGWLAWSPRGRPGHRDEAPGQPDLPFGPDRASTAPAASATDAALRLPNTDWLHHRLTVSGPVGDLAHFRLVAAGAGIIPWHLDLDRMAEDFFHLLVAPPAPQQRTLSLAGARIVADQLRVAVARRHGMAVTRVGQSRACPFDLHALVSVPPEMLSLGPDDPKSLDWLWTHWGTSQPLRQVAVDQDTDTRHPPAPGQGAVHLVFWSADWTPWSALAAIAARWPALRFELRPTYEAA